jgi:hypothetical protein
MSWALVQKNSTNGQIASGASISFVSTPAQYNLIVVSLQMNGASIPTSVKDGVGNSFTAAFAGFGASQANGLYFYVAGASQNKSVIPTFTGKSFAVDIFEFSGNYNTLASVQNAGSTGAGATGTNTTTPATVVATVGGVLLFGNVALASSGGVAITANWTLGYSNPNATTSLEGSSFNTNGGAGWSAGTYTPTFTWTTSRSYVAGGAAFVPYAVPTVTESAITAITITGGTANGNVTSSNGSNLSAKGFIYAITAINASPTIGGTGCSTVIDGSTATGSYSDPLSGLTMGTGYSVTAYATNSAGTAYSTVVSFFTSPINKGSSLLIMGVG